MERPRGVVAPRRPSSSRLGRGSAMSPASGVDAVALQSRLYVSPGMQLVPRAPGSRRPASAKAPGGRRTARPASATIAASPSVAPPMERGAMTAREVGLVRSQRIISAPAGSFKRPASREQLRPISGKANTFQFNRTLKLGSLGGQAQKAVSFETPPGRSTVGGGAREVSSSAGRRPSHGRTNGHAGNGASAKRTGSRSARARARARKGEPGGVLYDLEAPPTDRKADRTDPMWFIERIKKHPSSMEFVYLSPVDKGSPNFNPYKLRIVPHADIMENDYYTISSKGVTHFINGGAEFVPLEQWVTEYHQYAAITTIPIFKKYRTWKSYTVWRSSSRSGKSKLCSNILQKDLFAAHDVLGPYLRKVRGLCVDLLKHSLFDIEKSATLTLSEFVAAQSRHKADISEKLEKFSQTVQATVAAACDMSLSRAKLDEEQAADPDMFATPSPAMGGARTGAARTGGGISGTQAVSYMLMAAKRTKCRRLASFIKLADYIVVNTVHELAVSSAKYLLRFTDPSLPAAVEVTTSATALEERTREDASARALREAMGEADEDAVVPMFKIQLLLKRDALEFLPSAKTFEEKITGDVNGLLKMYEQLLPEKVDKLVTNPEFLARYISPKLDERLQVSEVGEGPVLIDILENDPEYQALVGQISDSIARSFSECEDFAQMFRPFWEMYVENQKMDIADIERQDLGLDFYRAAMRTYREQMEQMATIPVMSDVGIIRIDSQHLKAILLPSPERCLEDLEELLPRLAKAECERLLTHLQEAITALDKEDHTVAQFVAKLNFLEKLESDKDAIQDDYDKVQSKYTLIEEYRSNIKELEEYAAYNTLPTKVETLHSKINLAEDTREKDVKKFSELLARDIQNLRRQIMDVQRMAQNEGLLSENENVAVILEYINGLTERIMELKKRAVENQKYEQVFKLPITQFDELDATVEDLDLKRSLWQSLFDWEHLSTEWKETAFITIDAAAMESRVQQFSKVAYRLEQKLPPNPVVPIFNSMVEDFKIFLPVVIDLRNPSLQNRHWEHIQETINRGRIVRDETFTLGSLIDLDVIEYKDRIAEISLEATAEDELDRMLKNVQATWAEVDLEVAEQRKDVLYLSGIEDILAHLEDSQIQISTVLGSRHVKAVLAAAEVWDRDLSMMRLTVTEWIELQRQWLYLESIFNSPDIARQLPAEDKRFKDVDRTWRDTMRKTKDKPNAHKICKEPDMYAKLQDMNTQLDVVQKSVDVYLEKKRHDFPRFYFLSDEELLKILSQTKNPQAVQPHLRKCFENIHHLEFEVEGKSVDIVAMESGGKTPERVPFHKPVKVRDAVESWLKKVEEAMQETLRKRAKEAKIDFSSKPREQWIFEHPAMLVIAIIQMNWALSVEHALQATNTNNSLIQLKNVTKKNIKNMAKLVRGHLEAVDRSTVTALITIEVHLLDIIEELVKAKVKSADEFTWLKQFRYYWIDDDIHILQTNASFKYGYEYLGCTPRLVVTPLTDRCYITLTGAMHLLLGGSPAGPAGTGKTETVKDLAKAMAIQCVVFNCSENLDVSMMGRFFSGLAASGAWACFDEFNRIEIEVLSVIATQLVEITSAKRALKTEFDFEGRHLKMNPRCAYFITMNPGYRGRTELPDNLKSLFRPIAMMIPNYRLIAEIILLSEGFESARVLASKMTQLYKLSSEQLSQQKHYDFGLRAVKSVLVKAGKLKRENESLDEDLVLIRALRDSNLPKLLADDIPLFQNIVNDLFPGVVLPDQDFGLLQQAIEDVLDRNGLQVVPSQVQKTVQLFETLSIRHGLMMIGPTGGGKTTCFRMLKEALTLLHEQYPDSDNPFYNKVDTYILNPKSVTREELYGRVDENTKEYTAGLVAKIVIEQCVEDESSNLKWVIFDGPVDATWIEDMNTVLDDNKLLCLPNSARVSIDDRVRMMFEVSDLVNASPATVSRCGMVYLEPRDLGWTCYVHSWMQGQSYPPVMVDRLLELFELSIDPALNFIADQCSEKVTSDELCKVTSVCKILEAVMTKERGMDFTVPDDDLLKIAEDSFFFAYVWGMGGNLDELSRDIFDTFAQDSFKDVTALPGQKSVYGYYVDMKLRCFRPWMDIRPEFEYDAGTPFFKMVVPTESTVSYTYLLDLLLSVEHPALLSGNTGVGKSLLVSSFCGANEERLSLAPVMINMSARTSSPRVQELLEMRLVRKKGREELGGPKGKRVVLFVDDVNMPKPDESGCQPPIELLRQYLDYGGVYDRPALFFKTIKDLSLIAACAPPEGGRNEMTARFKRHFSMLYIPNTSQETLQTIFGAIMTGFLADFPTEMRTVSSRVVLASCEVYKRICEELLPTPEKSHYTFNLRDLARVIQGICQARPGYLNSVSELVRMWAHENLRVFHDRLVCEEDRRYFTEMLVELVRRHFNQAWDHDDVFVHNPPMFGDYMRISADHGERVYEEILDRGKLQRVLEEYLDRCNMDHQKEVSLVLFKDAVEHVSRIARVLQQPRGSALLVGVAGTGKTSLTRLACYMADYSCMEIRLKKDYGASEFREDIQNVYKVAGVENKKVVFIVRDTQIVDEEFLEDISSILNSGEVPSLFEGEDYEQIIFKLRQDAMDAGVSNEPKLIYQHFIHRVRENLHVVLCMSPVGKLFRQRCLMFPSLVNCCTIDWFDEWPEDALLSVATAKLNGVDFGGDLQIDKKLAELCVTVHKSCAEAGERYFQELTRRYYLTPTSYLEFLSLYENMLDDKRNVLTENRERYQTGLSKLEETRQMVVRMEGELKLLVPELDEKSQATDILMKQLQEERQDADEMRQVVHAEKLDVKEQTFQTKVAFDAAETDLREVQPILDDALNSLNVLRKDQVSEVRDYKTPPHRVERCMEAVLILLGYSNPTWALSKSVLGDTHFLSRLEKYNKDEVPLATMAAVKKYIDSDFTPEAMMTSSVACASMCKWVLAIYHYAIVYRDVAPKRVARNEAQERLRIMTLKLAEKEAALAEVEDQLSNLQKTCEVTVAAKAELQERAERTKKHLERAEKLISGLANEAVRWQESSAELNVQLSTVVGDMFLSAACVAYHGPLTADYRERLVAKWQERCVELGVRIRPKFTLSTVLGSALETRNWQRQLLPTDDFSCQNALFVTRGRRWPLMIDPQEQANIWIKTMEGAALKVLKLTDSGFLRSLENAIKTGTPVLLEEVGETLDPALDPLLLMETTKQGASTIIRLGDSEFPYDPSFRFYMTTKLPNPHYLPDVCIKVTVINFTVTLAGLDDQLLGRVVTHECAEIEEQRASLIVSLANDRQQLDDIEAHILHLLFNSEGILEDDSLVETLQNSKTQSAQIKERVKQSEQTEMEVNAARERYRSVSRRGSLLYFVIADFARVDPMYQYSLEYFNALFVTVMNESTPSDVLPERLETLLNALTRATFANISRGLFAEHKILFSFLIAVNIMLDSGDVSHAEWGFFLRGGGMARREEQSDVPASWVTAVMWDLVHELDSIPPFQGILEHVTAHVPEWMEFYDAADPLQHTLPAPWEDKVSSFQRIIFLKVFRPECVAVGAAAFVENTLSSFFVESPPVSLPAIHHSVKNTQPIIFVLSAGADPSSQLLRFAEDRNMLSRLKIQSLGKDQGPKAEAYIKEGMKNGAWVFLQNCHLAKSWMPELARLVKELSSSEAVHKDFQLWLSSMPAEHFPVAVLQNGMKITDEPPRGIRDNLRRSLAEITDGEFEAPCAKPTAWKRLLLSLAFFHACVQERKKFGPLGWNKLYEFNSSDLDISRKLLRMFLEEGDSISFSAILFMTGEIAYGGRVTDDWDRRCLKTMLRLFYNPKAIEDGHTFSESGLYKIPVTSTLRSYMEYASTLPHPDDPSVFGLHSNANITSDRRESDNMLDIILMLQPRKVMAAGAESNDSVVLTLATELEEKLPANVSTAEPHPSVFLEDQHGCIPSLSTVLMHEIARFNILLDLVRSSLRDLKRAIKGLVVMSESLEGMFYSLLDGKVPKLWTAASFLSLKPLRGWMSDLALRVDALRTWCSEGAPTSYWLSGFFYPQGFLTGVLQTHARKYGVAIDTLHWHFTVLDTDEEGLTKPPEDGVYIHGLFLDGARWDWKAGVLEESMPKELFSKMPVIHLLPSTDGRGDALSYECPLYKTTTREGVLSTTGQSTNYVVPIHLKTRLPAHHWILRGVALVTQLND